MDKLVGTLTPYIGAAALGRKPAASGRMDDRPTGGNWCACYAMGADKEVTMVTERHVLHAGHKIVAAKAGQFEIHPVGCGQFLF